MATAVRVSIVSPHGARYPKTTNAGWVGSKAGVRGDLVTIDSNGKIDQAAAAGATVGTTVKLGILDTDIASSVAAASDEALAVKYQPIDDQMLLEVQLVTDVEAAETALTAAAAHVGDMIGFGRLTDGGYVGDLSETSHAQVVSVDTERNTAQVRLLPTLCLG